MKLGEKSFSVSVRFSIVCMLAIGVPKIFFVMHSQAQQKESANRALPYAHARFAGDETHSLYAQTTASCEGQYSFQNPSACKEVCSNGGHTYGVGKKDRETRALTNVEYEKTVALVTNQMHAWGTFASALEYLVAHGMTVHTLLVPFAYQTDLLKKKIAQTSFMPRTVPIITGDTDTLFSRNNLAGCDALCLDLQDTGIRTDGYVAVVYAALCAARDFKKELIIIDHPNPLGGSVEGWCSGTCKTKKTNSVLTRIPLRHGMTLGELACYMNRSCVPSPVLVTVVPLVDYDRFIPVDARSVHVPFSRNIQSLEACRCYSFLGLLGEIAPFDVAVGTRYAFQALLLPEKKTLSRAAWEEYRAMLKKHAFESRVWRYYSKRKKRWYVGVRMSISEGVPFSSTEIVVETLTFFKKRGIALTPSAGFDDRIGTSLVRQLVHDEISSATVFNDVRATNALFLQEAFMSCLYKPVPRGMSYANNFVKKK